MLKKILVIVLVIGALIGAAIFIGASDPWEEGDEGSRYATFAVMKDGSEVPLSGGFILQPNSIQYQGATISALKLVVQVAGTSPDYTNYRLLSTSQFSYRIAIVAPIIGDIWFHTQTVSGVDLFTGSNRILPFDDTWYTVPDKASSKPAWEIAADGSFLIPASWIQEKALDEITLDPGAELNVNLKIEMKYDLKWDVPEDTAFQTKELSGVAYVGLKLVEGEAGLEGEIVVG